jgi:hypothetical protein
MLSPGQHVQQTLAHTPLAFDHLPVFATAATLTCVVNFSDAVTAA